MQTVTDNKKELQAKAERLYASIQPLYQEVNHEEKTLRLEAMIKEYRGLCIGIHKKKVPVKREEMEKI